MRNNLVKGSGKWVTRAVSLIFWITVWYIASYFIASDLLLPSPSRVVARFFELIVTVPFLNAVCNSVMRILLGFFSALFIGVLLAILAGTFKPISVLISPFMSALKSIPVASFVILALLWLDSEGLSTFIAFVMVLPIIYLNTLSGINACDSDMRDMALVFGVSPFKKAAYVYLPYVIPFFKSGCAVSLGLCFKAGIAAELIGVPSETIGEQLYFSKIYFEMADLFATTLAIILISVLFEKLFMLILGKAVSLYERM